MNARELNIPFGGYISIQKTLDFAKELDFRLHNRFQGFRRMAR